MKNRLSVYEIILEVDGPVFIGNGKDISKKEYIMLPGKKLAVMNIEKLYIFIKKKGLARDFEQFMLQKSGESLKKWLERNRISFSDVRNCVRYVIANNTVSIENRSPIQILQCIKDPYGKPYVPGSSIKGMFRTILLGADLIQHSEKYHRESDELVRELYSAREKNRRILNKSIQRIENKRFHQLGRSRNISDAVNDEMSGFIVGDSDPLDMQDIIVCQKVERHTDGSETSLNVLRECLRPGTKIKCMLTIDENICKIGLDQLKEAISLFARQYYDNYSRHFPGVPRPEMNQVYLGGGCGFVSKTMIYPMFPKKQGVEVTKEIFDKTKVSFKHKHNLDMKYGVSPHILKCTKVDGKSLPMGACRLEIRRIH